MHGSAWFLLWVALMVVLQPSMKPYPEYRMRWFWYWAVTGKAHPEHAKFCRERK